MILLRLAIATALLAKKSAVAIFPKSYIWSDPAQIALIGPTLSVDAEDWTSAMKPTFRRIAHSFS
jgi:hypothetical protein